jgi:toxin-antitoxin system PIN domain toxin
MRALLDINVLLALLDQAHVHHRRARTWFTERHHLGWASCPLTQNGFIRIISQPSYPNSITPAHAVALLNGATADPGHEFWTADVSLLDPATVDPTRLLGPRQVTDIYLLALAVHHGGCFATFDGGVSLDAVPGATSAHLVVL